MDQGPARHLRRRRRARHRGARRPYRRTGAGRTHAGNSGPENLRRRRARGAARAHQHPPPFLPDADASGAGSARPRIVSLVAGALSDLGALDAGSARPRHDAGDGGVDAVRLHHHDRPSLCVSRRRGRRHRYRSRRRTAARPARAADARLDESVAARRRAAAGFRGAGRGHHPGRQRARGGALSRAPARTRWCRLRWRPARRSRSPRR